MKHIMYSGHKSISSIDILTNWQQLAIVSGLLQLKRVYDTLNSVWMMSVAAYPVLNRDSITSNASLVFPSRTLHDTQQSLSNLWKRDTIKICFRPSSIDDFTSIDGMCGRVNIIIATV